MALRLVEFLIPKTDELDLHELLKEAEVVSVWEQPCGEGRVLARVLVDAEKTQPVLDRFQQRFGYYEDFRALLLPVEGTLPLPDEREPEPEPAPDAKPQPKKLHISREELRDDLEPGTRISRTFLITVVLSTVVAAVGLMYDSVAVIIGAMVIAPLLTPNMALALGTTLGDLSLVRNSMRTQAAGVALALTLAVLVGVLLPFDSRNDEMMSRTTVGPSDVVLALAAGCAGTLAFTTGVSASLVGVMVAVALLPPLVVAGLLLGRGELSFAWGAFGLLATNIICVNLAAVTTFLLKGIRPRTWWEAGKAKRATRIALTIWAVLLLALIALLAS